jgi:hypothetical protein
MELLMRKNVKYMLVSIGIEICEEKLPIYAYLQLRFMGTNNEIWIRVKDLIAFQNSEKKTSRDTNSTMLDIIKNEKNEIMWEWRINNLHKHIISI